MRNVLWVTLFLLVHPLGAQAPADDRADALRTRIAERIARTPGAFASVLYLPVSGADRLAMNADSMFHAASTMKVPVLIEFWRQVDRHAIDPDQSVLLVNSFASIVDQSPYTLDAGDDSDSTLYARVGHRVATRELVDRMITRSSNLATNAVISLVGATAVQQTARDLGAPHIRVLRGVEDGKAFRAGLNNITSARDLAVLLEAIEAGRAASAVSCKAMLETLLRQEFNLGIPAGLPSGTPVAHKTGWITGTTHDAAIVYPPGKPPYVLVVLTRGIPEEAVAQQLIADISRMVWEDAAAR